MKNLIVFAFTVILCNCNEINLKEFTTGNREFTAEVYKNLAETNENFLLCPISVATVLAVAQSGAKNETGEEIRKALHLPNNVQKVETIFKHLNPKLKSRKTYTLLNANKIYIQNDYPIKKKFLEVAKKIYHCPVENVDFSQKEEAVKTMNDWVQNQTNNKIHHIIDPESLDDLTKAIFINTVYFKGEWQKNFKHYFTKKGSFFKTAEETVEVDMMHGNDEYSYYESKKLDAKFLKLGFKYYFKAQMIFVLPNKKDGLEELEKHIDKVLITPTFIHQRVKVVLPKFKIETKVDFYEILKNMGMEKSFGKDADFSGIAGKKGDLHISEIVQKTFIDVREDGVEATAASSVQFSSRSSLYLDRNVNFIADHPFLFYIKIKNIIVFAGRVLLPST